MASEITARAPSSTANLGPGFDVFGLAVDAFHDEITLTRQDGAVSIVADGGVPTKPGENTAGLVVRNMRKKFGIKDGLEIRIRKGVPAGFGMGSSAASAAAVAVAMNELFQLSLDDDGLTRYAGYGERASAGVIHYDNVAASVLGGFVIVRTRPLGVIKIKPPADLRMCIAVPKLRVPKNKTKVSRGAVPKKISLSDSVTNLSNAAAMVAGFLRKDTRLIGSSIRDVIVEPARMGMIPGFQKVKKNALNAGALGVTISGAGPSVIAFADRTADWKGIAGAMERGFASAGTGSQTFICQAKRRCESQEVVMERAIVVFSGGIDSVCAASMLKPKFELYGITFSYGQRASREVRTARKFARVLGMKKHKIVDIGFMKGLYGDSNVLTSERKSIPESFDYSIVVPVRNAVFLSVAAAWAYAQDVSLVAYGAHIGDRHYPDCRPAFAKKLAAALNQGETDGIRSGLRRSLEIWSPYTDGISKSDLIQTGYKTLGDSVFDTWSCYADGRYHCGVCESCRNRRGAFASAGIPDGTRYLK